MRSIEVCAVLGLGVCCLVWWAELELGIDVKWMPWAVTFASRLG